jgi:hypothetical protein
MSIDMGEKRVLLVHHLSDYEQLYKFCFITARISQPCEYFTENATISTSNLSKEHVVLLKIYAVRLEVILSYFNRVRTGDCLQF